MQRDAIGGRAPERATRPERSRRRSCAWKSGRVIEAHDIAKRFQAARDRGEQALAALWTELHDEVGSTAASAAWLRLWSGLDASET